ncbi:MAG: hypothetical protein OER95_14945, partial [Acidimicrobiia bacterium]|nr:hypothetical protein [Acidimicrobiia bacterium]
LHTVMPLRFLGSPRHLSWVDDYRSRRSAALSDGAAGNAGSMIGCLRHHTSYDEHTAWAHRHDLAA